MPSDCCVGPIRNFPWTALCVESNNLVLFKKISPLFCSACSVFEAQLFLGAYMFLVF